MSELDWTELTSSLGAGTVRRGVTGGATPPNGGTTFVYGWNSLNASEGVHALYTNQTNFAPMSKGGSISAAIKRAPSGGRLNFAPFLFMSLNDNDTSSEGYMLGLSDSDPAQIVLRKGALTGGLPDDIIAIPPPLGVLRHTVDGVPVDEWRHIRMDVIANDNGDVVINVSQNDLTQHAVTAPVWVPIPGMGQFVDDVLGVNSGSPPLVGGYAGFGFYTRDASRRAYIDHVEIRRQT